jgi:hypothetical protein
MLLPISGSPHKKGKKYKKRIYIYIYNIYIYIHINEKRWSGNQENGQNLVEEVQIQRLKFDSKSLTDESPVDKENSIRGRKVQNQMFMNLIKLY